MKTRKPKPKTAHGGARPGAGRPLSPDRNSSLRLLIPQADHITLAEHPDGYRLAKAAVVQVAASLRKPPGSPA